MFVVETYYIVDPELAKPHMGSHKQFVEKYINNKVILFAGPKHDNTGGIIIMNGLDLESVAKIMDEDSYVSMNIVEVKISEFNPLFSSIKLLDPSINSFSGTN